MNVLILGGTGLVGSDLLEILTDDKRIGKIDLLSRRELDLRDMKVTNHVVDFSNLTELPVHHRIDVLFIAFGTTLKKAGSQNKQWEIDVDIPTHVMDLARRIGVKKCVLISSIGVGLNSPFFYGRMKARLDDNAKKIGFEDLIIIKPSVLVGARFEKRNVESWSIAIGNLIGKTGLIDKYKPVESMDVAKCMIQSVIEHKKGFLEIVSDDIADYAARYVPQKYEH